MVLANFIAFFVERKLHNGSVTEKFQVFIVFIPFTNNSQLPGMYPFLRSQHRPYQARSRIGPAFNVV
jgi:hypothetical protein